MQIFGLCDCNNFYASCERLFDPSLRNKPIVVLSNNDGCVISRSDEAKKLGVVMGTPWFMIEKMLEKEDVKVFSSNYTLYGDMSARVMNSLQELCPHVEVYSIDEAFLSFENMERWNLSDFAVNVRKTVKKWTGIPVSIGLAPSRSLAKMANKLAKHTSEGVFVISDANREEILKAYKIEDVWGIGRKHEERLKKHGVLTAWDFTQLPDGWIKDEMSIVGTRLVTELRGQPVLDMIERPRKKAIATTRSFGYMLTDLEPVAEAVASYASRCGEKLRADKSCAGVMQVFLHTNEHRHDQPQYARSLTARLPVATNTGKELVHHALLLLKEIFKEGYFYNKAGVVVSGIMPDDQVQTHFFDTEDREKNLKLSLVMDKLNQAYGRNTVKFTSQGIQQNWKIKAAKLSPCYTTRWSDVVKVKCE